MSAQQINAKFQEIKKEVAKRKDLTPEQKDMYLLGWLDCSLWLLKEQEND